MNNINSIYDTISAITTPLGTGGVGIVRISGGRSLEIISQIFSLSSTSDKLPVFEPNKAYHGWIKSGSTLLDEVMVIYFKAPKSFTGEDVTEIHCHGGLNVVKNILELAMIKGSRLALKGEFTKRAFLNGKMDLSKAEAVLDIIHSKTSKFSELSALNLSGKLAQEIRLIRKDLLDLLSKVTAAIDFPEEVEEPDYLILEETINILIEKIKKILQGAKSSNLLRQGVKLAIVGRPNAGKSSLFNALLNLERAIVTDIAGTTRDIIQESLDIKGIPVTLIDTAGIRELENEDESNYIESIGIKISKKCIQDADIVIFVIPLDEEIQDSDKVIYEALKDKTHIIVGSKSDICNSPQCQPSFVYEKTAPVIMLSAKTGSGLDKLREKIENIVLQNDLSAESEFTTNIRQQECLTNVQNALLDALDGVKKNELQDLISIDLKSALIFVGEITGEEITEEILDNIFENFCIGK
jgi:tRNA modification GTPase